MATIGGIYRVGNISSSIRTSKMGNSGPTVSTSCYYSRHMNVAAKTTLKIPYVHTLYALEAKTNSTETYKLFFSTTVVESYRCLADVLSVILVNMITFGLE